jgi:hypothetical protein
VQKRILDL